MTGAVVSAQVSASMQSTTTRPLHDRRRLRPLYDPAMTEAEGAVEPGFEGGRDAFSANFDERGDIGAAFALYGKGVKVVDIWGGTAELKTGKPYGEDSLQLVSSTTTGATAIAANLLAQRGLLE